MNVTKHLISEEETRGNVLIFPPSATHELIRYNVNVNIV